MQQVRAFFESGVLIFEFNGREIFEFFKSFFFIFAPFLEFFGSRAFWLEREFFNVTVGKCGKFLDF